MISKLFHLLPIFLVARNVVVAQDSSGSGDHYSVLVLGGGIAGVIAARTLHEAGVDDYLLVEANTELGGRIRNWQLGDTVVEVGGGWIQGSQPGDEAQNPILTLAEMWNVSTAPIDYSDFSYYDFTGPANYSDQEAVAGGSFDSAMTLAGERRSQGLVDISARTALSLLGSVPSSPQAWASEYAFWDWEFGVPPEETSLIASALRNNYTFGDSTTSTDRISTDQRGFKTIVQSEAASFMTEQQLLLNSTVKSISYSSDNTSVTLSNGRVITADHVLCTFSAGVLQHNDVTFEPALPDWKREAISSLTMSSYSEIFMRFPNKFWFDSTFGLYADRARGTYPIFHSYDHPDLFPDSGILSTTVTGDYSRWVTAISNEEIKDEVVAVLKTIFPEANVTEPEELFFHRWDSDPWFRGASSVWFPAYTKVRQQNLRADIGGRLWFAGEATSRDFNGLMQGAYFEGQDIAQEILKCLNVTGNCAGLSFTDKALATNAT
ncbi:hypothetical protein HGRIS_002630 [Hohenbuehelia grisea]